MDNKHDINLESYLNELAVQYVMTDGPTIKFSNALASYIKMKEFLFVNVKYDSKFGSTNKIFPNTPYTTKQRIATIKLEKADNQWKALIADMAFYDPNKPLFGTENDVDVYADTSATATPVTQESIADEVASFVTQKQAEEKKKQETFNKYVSLGVDEMASKQYKNALESFANAKNLYPVDPSLDRKIYEAKRLAAEFTYDKFKNAGDRALNERRLKDAAKAYQTALDIEAAKSNIVRPLLDSISRQISLISPANSKLESGLYDQAIQDCEAILTTRDHKKTPEKFPELFYIEGRAYEKLADQKPDEKSYVDKALKNYSFSHTICPYLCRGARCTLKLLYQVQNGLFQCHCRLRCIDIERVGRLG